MTDANHAREELQRLADVAKDQGRVKIEATCLLALACLEELEAALLIARGNARQGARTRMQRLTPAQRRTIATAAANHRWGNHASG